MAITISYKQLPNGVNLNVDLYLPDNIETGTKLSAVAYFHGGGLTVGDRTSWFPSWLQSVFNQFLALA
jgi:acetyl esterase/lipase